MLYNLSVVELMGSLDAAFINRLIYIFIDSILPELDELNKAHQEKNFTKLATVAHAIKSNIDVFSINSISNPIRILEKKNFLSTLPDDELAGYVQEITTVIKNVIAEMKKDYPIITQII